MNGFELAEEIKKLNKLNLMKKLKKKIKIILLTADEPTEEYKNNGIFDQIIIKPIPMKILENMCTEIKKLNNTNKNKSEDCDVMFKSSQFYGSYNNSNVSHGFSY
jgi:two-component SAPR family response regulator